MAIRLRRALVGLATTAAVLALPAVASAAVTPALTVTARAPRPPARAPRRWVFDATFTKAGARPNDVTFALPTGLLAMRGQAGGACLISSTPTTGMPGRHRYRDVGRRPRAR